MNNKKATAVILAFLAAIFYAVGTPASKLLLSVIPATMMAAFLYLGAGIGMGTIFLFSKDKSKTQLLTKEDLPYTIGMILLDIAAPILLMIGLSESTASSASLLNNFEIVATTLIALLFFKEKVTKRLWCGIALITIASILLSIVPGESLSLSNGSFCVLLATVFWGLENNCTRSISDKNTYQIVMVKGLCCGCGSLLISLFIGEKLPSYSFCLIALLVGFISYGLSIFFYIKAQNTIGAAKTSAYYAVAPFVGAFISFIFFKESLVSNFVVALLVMIVGSVLVVFDTLVEKHNHIHTHVIVHTHDNSTHTHTVTHDHGHTHFVTEGSHEHTHSAEEIHHEIEHQA